jgi:cell filamentation protein
MTSGARLSPRSTARRASGPVYAAEPDPYCYSETNVLKNRLDLRNAEELEAFEADAITQRGDEPLPDGDLSPRHLREIHHHLFQDVYD